MLLGRHIQWENENISVTRRMNEYRLDPPPRWSRLAKFSRSWSAGASRGLHDPFHSAPTETGAKPAKQQAQSLHDWLIEHGIDQMVAVIFGDTIVSISGHKEGMLAHLESMLGRLCFVVVCCLHINELPLRHLSPIWMTPRHQTRAGPALWERPCPKSTA